MASNPVFNKFDKELSGGQYAQFSQPQYGQYASPQQQSQAYYGSVPGQQPQAPYGQAPSAQQLNDMYAAPAATPAQTGRMTLDDVVTKTLSLFGIVLLTGAIGWFASSQNHSTGMALWMAGMFGGLIVGIVISFMKTVSVPLILAYSALEGLFLGACSQYFNSAYPGVVAEAVIATLCVFGGMFAGWKFGIIRVTERSRKIFGLLALGYFLFALVNVVLLLTGVLHGWGIGGNGKIGLLISVLAVALASYSIAVDFDSIQRGVSAGLPQKYSWLMAHGLIVSIVWLYIELLRLFARMRNN